MVKHWLSVLVNINESKNNMKRILITGANSFVGTSVERWLMKEPEKYRVDTVDTMNEKWREADMSLYDTVFHVAGIAHVDPKPEMAPLYYKVNRDLTIEIAKHAKDCGVRQFVFMSSKIVYQASKSLKGDVVTRDSRPNPNDFYGDSKLQAENGLKELESPNFRVAILRPCMIYGPQGKGNFLRLAWLATKAPFFPEWHNKRSMLYIDNLAEFVKQIIDRDLQGTFYPQNAELADSIEIVRFFAGNIITRSGYRKFSIHWYISAPGSFLRYPRFFPTPTMSLR